MTRTIRHLSPSAIGMWKRCARQWAFVYLEGRRNPPSGAMHLGTSAHKSFEAHNRFKLKSRTDLPLDELEDRYSEAFKAVPQSEVAWEGESPERIYDDGAAVVRLFGNTSAKRVQPLVVEQPVITFMGPDLPPLKTVLDCVDEEQIVVDYKTSAKQESGKAANSDQLTAYALAHIQQFGVPPRSLRLDIFVRPTKMRPLGLFDPQETSRGEEQVEIFKQDAKAVFSQIQQGERTGLFPYAPMDSWACSEKFCGFYNVCPGGAARRVSFGFDAPNAQPATELVGSAMGSSHEEGRPAAEAPAEA